MVDLSIMERRCVCGLKPSSASKWLKSIELVEDYRKVGEGQGGYREDDQYFGTGAEI